MTVQQTVLCQTWSETPKTNLTALWPPGSYRSYQCILSRTQPRMSANERHNLSVQWCDTLAPCSEKSEVKIISSGHDLGNSKLSTSSRKINQSTIYLTYKLVVMSPPTEEVGGTYCFWCGSRRRLHLRLRLCLRWRPRCFFPTRYDKTFEPVDGF